MAKLHVLALAPSRALGAEIARALGALDCVVHEGYTGEGMGEIIRKTSIDAVVFAGPLPGLSAERILTAVTERVPGAKLILALPDVSLANAYAQRYHGHALPWPLSADAVAKLLSQPTTTSVLVPRREPRLRFLGGATVEAAGETHPALIINISTHGAMVLTGCRVEVGAVVRVEVPYGAAIFTLTGEVKHVGENANRNEALAAAPWLRVGDASIFGLEFVAHSLPSAMAFCTRIASERALLNLRVTCVPSVPKGLLTIFQRSGIRVETQRALPSRFEAQPPILLVDVSTCSLDELKLLREMSRLSVIISVATTPLTDPARAQIAAALPGLFMLPFQSESLLRHVEEFFAPVDRKFPRLEEPFTLLYRERPGETRALEGVNLSLHGCAFLSAVPFEPGMELGATLAMDQAIDAYPICGRIVYCLPDATRYRVGVNFEVAEPAVASYRQYLSARFLKLLRIRWEEQLQAAGLA